MMRTSMKLGLTLAVLALGVGCSDDSKPPVTDQGGSKLEASAKVEASVKAEGGTGAEASVKPEGGVKTDAATGPTVEVTYAGKSYTVDILKPAAVTVLGASYSRLSDVVLLALPGKDLSTLNVDFEGDGGFKPGAKANCATLIPIGGDKLAKGYVQRDSRNMAWDDDLAYPGCMSAKGLAKIILADKAG